MLNPEIKGFGCDTADADPFRMLQRARKRDLNICPTDPSCPPGLNSLCILLSVAVTIPHNQDACLRSEHSHICHNIAVWVFCSSEVGTWVPSCHKMPHHIRFGGPTEAGGYVEASWKAWKRDGEDILDWDLFRVSTTLHIGKKSSNPLAAVLISQRARLTAVLDQVGLT